MGNGKWGFELIALRVAGDFSQVGELGQSRTDGGGAQTTEFAQLVNRDRLLELSQGLADSRPGRGFWAGFRGRPIQDGEGQSRSELGELEGNVI